MSFCSLLKRHQTGLYWSSAIWFITMFRLRSLVDLSLVAHGSSLHGPRLRSRLTSVSRGPSSYTANKVAIATTNDYTAQENKLTAVSIVTKVGSYPGDWLPPLFVEYLQILAIFLHIAVSICYQFIIFFIQKYKLQFIFSIQHMNI